MAALAEARPEPVAQRLATESHRQSDGRAIFSSRRLAPSPRLGSRRQRSRCSPSSSSVVWIRLEQPPELPRGSLAAINCAMNLIKFLRLLTSHASRHGPRCAQQGHGIEGPQPAWTAPTRRRTSRSPGASSAQPTTGLSTGTFGSPLGCSGN